MQPVEALLPERPVPGDPVRDRLERPGIQAAVADAAIAPPLQQAGFLQDLEVLRDGGERHVERLREVRDPGLSQREPREDGAPRRIGERAERPVHAGGRIVNHLVN